MNALITAPGAYPGIDTLDYHRNPDLLPGPSISSSGLKTIMSKSPRHFWWNSPLNPERPAENDASHFAMGKAAHDLLLLSERWPECYHVLPAGFSWASSRTKNFTDDQLAALAAREEGKVLLKADEAETVEAMAAALRANPFAAAALSNGESEVTLAWQDEETGVWLRARPDFLPNVVRGTGDTRAVPDLKTAADASPRAFQRAIANFGYHQSAALYADGIKAVFGLHPTHWVHVVMEKEPPHVVALYELPGEDIERGRWLNRKAIRRFADCLSADKWPGYSDDVSACGLPGWERKVIDDDTTLHGEWPVAA